MIVNNSPLLPRDLIQVAGVHDIDEAALLLDLGVDLVGMPLRLTVNVEDLSEEEARNICAAFPGKCCLITYLNQSREIIEFVEFFNASVIQLHGEVEAGQLKEVKAALPGLCIIKSLVIGRFPMVVLEQHVEALCPYVSAFITDTYNAATGAEGATGMTHDWELSRHLCQLSPLPLILAGGLSSTNVGHAIVTVKPWGVDVHTGVEDADGRKTAVSVKPFVDAARCAFANR